ncbi:MAG: lytic transglycosylase domain-containing protein, partial [Candidatus Woesearchaeota archaeon]
PSPTSVIEGLKQKTTFKTKGGRDIEASRLASLIAKIESGYDENAVSPKGAIGLMQLMPATAKMLGVNPLVAEENVRGGEEYIMRLLDQFGDLDKALAAYNWGEGNLRKAIEKHGNEWHKALPAETRNYLKRFYTELFNAS